jgi:Tol biopolymer transport system component
VCATAAAALTATAGAQETTRVSVDSSGGEADKFSDPPVLSADGVIVVFPSLATNLVAGDLNGLRDVFVHDRATGLTERVSVDSTGAEADSESTESSISADGAVVVFTSRASNLVAGDQNGSQDLFVHERATGLTERVSVNSSGVEGDRDSNGGRLSGDGSLAVFSSWATNLVPGDTNDRFDVFLRDRVNATTVRVSVDSGGAQANGESSGATISADGKIVAFASDAANLVPGDTNGSWDVFVHELSTGITERVSVDSSGVEGDGGSFTPSLSSDGRFVAFASLSSNLVAGDANASSDVFVHDRATGLTERVSVDAAGGEANDGSMAPVLSADGKRVAFHSWASNLVAGDTNVDVDVFLRDRSTATTLRLSVRTSGRQGNGGSDSPSLSADGSTAAFRSNSTNLVAGDTNAVSDAFVHELCSTPASWSNYGSGFPGTFGVPSFTSQQNPVLGTTITLDLANSYQQPTAGLLFVGFQRTSLHSGWGGDLLMVPALTLPISFSFGFNSYSGAIPDDPTLCGLALDLQAIEADPGAAEGVSFTPGLELVLGR